MQRKLVLTLLASLATPLFAEDVVVPEPPKWYEKVSVDGFADAYYKYNHNGAKGSAVAPATVVAGESVFDVRQNAFAISGGRLGLHSADGAAVIDLYFGDMSAILAGSVAPLLAGNYADNVSVGQAYIAQPLGETTVTLGKFFTHVGYELADSVANWNFSRGLLYAQVPFYHQGVKLSYASQGFGLMGMVDNGSNLNYPTTEATGAGAQASYTHPLGAALYLNYYYEPEVSGAFPSQVWERKHLFDVVGSFKAGEGLNVALEYLFLTRLATPDKDVAGDVKGTYMVDPETGKKIPLSPKTHAYAAYLDYATSYEGLFITPRFEALYEPDAGLTRFDYTATLRLVRGAITNWLEVRVNASDDAIYAPAPKDTTIGDRSYNEATVTYAVGYKF